MVKLDVAEARWVRQQGTVFGSHSAVIRTAVRVVLGLISRGIVRWEFSYLQEILRGNPERALRVIYAWKGIASSRDEAIAFMAMISRIALRPSGSELRGAL